MNNKIITKKLLVSWNACASGLTKFCELFPKGADLQTAVAGLCADGHNEWAKWLFDKCKQHKLFEEITSKGYRNSGDWNSGDWNSGNGNSGYRNSGDRNSGNANSGYRNSGDWNSGDRNSGNWNSGDWNSGFFNTITPDEILIFNKPSTRSVWKNTYIPHFLFFPLTYWVNEFEMSDADKQADPNFYVCGDQLRKRDYKEAFKLAWENADPADRIKIKDLPNFDAKIFFEISGINVDEESK